MKDCTGTRLFDLLNDDYLTDVTFQVQDVEIKAHRLVLVSGGGVLKKLLEKNRAKAAGNKIKIKDDVTSEAFKTVLQFIYTDSCQVNDANLFEVTHAATVFKLDILEKYCANVTKTKLSVSNVGAYASYAVELDAKENVKVCQEYFRSNTLQVIKTDEFLKISHNALLALCSSDGIACSEVDLFLACVEWAKRECQRKRWEVTPENQRAALGDVLAKIRFPAMKKEEFEEKVVPLEILTYEEVGRLIVGWRKKEQRTDFYDESRSEMIEITITDHRVHKYPSWNSNLTLPLSTRILDLKSMKIFHNCTWQYKPETFTLAYKGTILRNEETLASIYTPGEKLVIDVHSIDVTVKDDRGRWQFPFTIKSSEIERNWDMLQIVKGAIYSHRGFKPLDKDLTQRIVVDDNERVYYYGNRDQFLFAPGSVILVDDI